MQYQLTSMLQIQYSTKLSQAISLQLFQPKLNCYQTFLESKTDQLACNNPSAQARIIQTEFIP